MGTMKYNNITSESMGVIIQTPPVYEFPSKIYEGIQIAGKNGELIIDSETYSNTDRTYFLALVFPTGTTFVENASKIVEWLTSANGYAELEDSYDPEHYRLAMFKDNGQLTNLYDKATAINVSFNCKPQRFLKTGRNEITINSLDVWVEIINPTNYKARPIINVEGKDITIEFTNGVTNPGTSKQSVVVDFETNGYIDSELEDCYSQSEYLNNMVELTNGFPILHPGKNWVRVSGTELTTLKIKPRWWRL